MGHIARRKFLKQAACAASIAWASSKRIKAEEQGNAMDGQQLSPNLHLLPGAVNTGVLIKNDKALLFDCCDSVTIERLEKLGVQSVETIGCTQYRRPNTAGAYSFVEAGAQLVVPKGERNLFDEADAYWNDPKNRWHLYHSRPGPQVLPRPIPVTRCVVDGDTIEWQGFQIKVIDTPGMTDGSVSYLVEDGGTTFAFSGDALCAPGQIWDLYSLQKGFDTIRDYHGFLGARPLLISSLHKLAECDATVLIPSHGAPIHDPKAATALVEDRLHALWRNYTSISALNYYFPTLFDETKDDKKRMPPAENFPPPEWIPRVAATSFAVISDTGAAFLIDCGNDSVVATLQKWIEDKKINAVEGCWITHYHDDHVDGLPHFAEVFKSPILADSHLAEIIEHPQRFFLPCISPCAVPIAHTTRHGESWTWHEFTFTAFHFPGQTFYHGGLLVESHGKKVFFAGDSGAPTGLDDYCAGNRVFLGADRGSRRCLALWRKLQPDYIINAHQDRAFSFTQDQLNYMDAALAERENLIAELVPWEDPNFATDESWVRTYPYEQEASPGATLAIEVQFTNHGPSATQANVEPVLPGQWLAAKHTKKLIPAKNDNATLVEINVPKDTAPGRYTIPFRITWGNHYLGQFRHAIVVIR